MMAGSGNDHSHFDFLTMNEISISASIKLDCRSIICSGQVSGRWVQASRSDGRITFIEVIYNEKKLDGSWVSTSPVSLTDAIREHSFQNSRTRPDFGVMRNDRGQVISWVDKGNRIVYEQNPDDEAKGITQVEYVEGDAPILKRSRASPDLDKTIAGLWHSLLEEPKASGTTP